MKFTLQVEQRSGLWHVTSEEISVSAETFNEALDAVKVEWVKVRLASAGGVSVLKGNVHNALK